MTEVSVDPFLEAADPECASSLAFLPDVDLRDIPALRVRSNAMWTSLRETLGTVDGVVVADRMAGSVPVRTYEPDDRVRPSGALVWIHGGGMVAGNLDSTDWACQRWAAAAGCLIVSVDYRLAPEWPFPAPIDDCHTALRWVHDNADDLGIDPGTIVLGGASAGGGLAAGTALLARDRGEVAVHAQMLVYPMLDDRAVTPSSQAITYPKTWNVAANALGWKAYLGDKVGDPFVPIYAAPARASVDDLRGLPPAFVDVGQLDLFRDEDIDYATRLMQAGVPCELLVTPGAFHGSEAMAPAAASSRRINHARLDWLRRAVTPG